MILMSTSALALVDIATSTASADNSGDFTYSVIDGGTAVEITGYSGSSESVVIPSSIGDLPVTGIGDHLFEDTDLTSVTLPSNVTSIGDWAFCGCTKLSSVTMPDDVKSIGNGNVHGMHQPDLRYHTGQRHEHRR